MIRTYVSKGMGIDWGSVPIIGFFVNQNVSQTNVQNTIYNNYMTNLKNITSMTAEQKAFYVDGFARSVSNNEITAAQQTQLLSELNSKKIVTDKSAASPATQVSGGADKPLIDAPTPAAVSALNPVNLLSGAGNFITQYKTPLMIGGALIVGFVIFTNIKRFIPKGQVNA